MKCKNCNIESTLLFCAKCGEIIEGAALEFIDKDFLKQSQDELIDFINNIKVKNSPVTAPNKKMQKYFDKVSEMKNLLEIYKQSFDKESVDDFIKEADNFLKQEDYLEIAFVGTIKAGKSTLINAMLKAEYASTDVTPETATLTKFVKGEKPLLKIIFYSKSEWEELWKEASTGSAGNSLFMKKYNELNAESHKDDFIDKAPKVEAFSVESLKNYTSSKAPQHFFIKEVVISYPDFPYEKNIMFVDTPGLDDPVPYRSKITRDYISSAEVVLVCNRVGAMDGKQLQTIFGAFDQTGGNPHKVYVLGTRYDSLNDYEEEWKKQKAEWIGYLTNQNKDSKYKELSCYTQEMANKNIINVSAYTALLCELYKKGKLDEKREKELKTLCYKVCNNDDIKSNIDELLRFANVDSMHIRIKEDILNKAQEYILEGAKNGYEILADKITNYIDESINSESESYKAISSNMVDINKQVDRQKGEIEAIAESRKALEKEMREFNEEVAKMKSDIEKSINSLIKDK